MSNFPGALQIDSVQYISSEYTKQIPGIAYQVPDIDAVVKLVVKKKIQVIHYLVYKPIFPMVKLLVKPELNGPPHVLLV